MNSSITSSDLTSAYTPADCLAMTDGPINSINAVRLQSDTNRKSVRIKFKVKKLSRGTDKNENENFTTAINAQGNTGANCLATDTIDTIHNYVEFTIQQEVGVFSGDERGTTLHALGEGVTKILSDQGSIMEWRVLYTPLSSGTVLSPDNYQTTHKSKYYAFYHTVPSAKLDFWIKTSGKWNQFK
jgi:hypothetical protein